jgi:hypothetical protein
MTEFFCSITLDANPTGINQYTGAAGYAAKASKAASRANGMKSTKAIRAEMHGKAAAAHQAAAKLAPGPKEKSMHEKAAKEHANTVTKLTTSLKKNSNAKPVHKPEGEAISAHSVAANAASAKANAGVLAGPHAEAAQLHNKAAAFIRGEAGIKPAAEGRAAEHDKAAAYHGAMGGALTASLAAKQDSAAAMKAGSNAGKHLDAVNSNRAAAEHQKGMGNATRVREHETQANIHLAALKRISKLGH